ncbi:hypothetical protein [Emcibacter sp. SYSU 3D8]|uniref:hypothetical protein n=1 Tax=Emcibacter sp. SYSU 3D8 TaxID=3133969 RepID=UPI0031FEE0B5
MNAFDYQVPAELFLRGIGAGGKRLVYKRFVSAAAAVQFAVEGASGFATATLEVDGDRFEKADIRRLYDADDYPLSRNVPLAA